MTRIKFAGFQPYATVTMSAQQAGLTRGPVTVSAWKASQIVSDAGTFRVRTSIVDETWMEVSNGDVIETVAPGRVRVWVDGFVDWADDDPRNIWVDVDYGERYDFQHTDHADLPAPNVLRRLAGTQAGYYPGILSGHAMRGTDMSGNQVLTATYDPGNGAPLGTLDQTVTVTVTDGLATNTLTFIVRLVHPDVYYEDRAKIIFTGGLEPQRYGTVYVSTDGDFTDAPAARSSTPLKGGIFHITYANGEFSSADLRTKIGLPWGDENTSTRVLFKAGQVFKPTTMLNPTYIGVNGTLATWYHNGTGGTAKATLSAEKLQSFDPKASVNLIGSNFFQFSGARFVDLKLHVSDYDTSDVTWREWWNIINYTGKTGPLAQNIQGNLSAGGYNGETLTNGNGVYTQVISDDGVGTLICRQVVDTANVDDAAAEQAFFNDGDTLTGQSTGETMTFVAAGSRQDRTRKIPGKGINLASAKGLLVQGVEIIGAETGISGMGVGAHVSDTLIKNFWNYGMQQTGGDRTSTSEAGNVTVQPLSYEGTPRDFGGATVSGNRNYFNAMMDAASLATNDISHACRRFAFIDEYSNHYCFSHTYGGHGGGHQPAYRMATGGPSAEKEITAQFYGGGVSGGGTQITFSLAGGGSIPYTPNVIRVEAMHLRGNHSTTQTNFISIYTNYALRNSILDRPAGFGAWPQKDIQWLAHPETAYSPDPDINAVSPIVEFCTMIAKLNTSPASTVSGPDPDLRGTPIIYRNNAYIVDQAVMGTVDVAVLVLSDAPDAYDGNLRPLAAASAYQDAVLPVVPEDAVGSSRPADASRGAFEPA